MTIKFACQCGKVLVAKKEAAGKRAKCKYCGQAIIVPKPDEPASLPDRTSIGLHKTPTVVETTPVPAAQPASQVSPIPPSVADAQDAEPISAAVSAVPAIDGLALPHHEGASKSSRLHVATTEFRRRFKELPLYFEACRAWFAKPSEASTKAAIHYYVEPSAPVDETSPLSADFAVSCALCGKHINAAPQEQTLAVRDNASLLFQGLLAACVAIVFWLALNDLYTSKPPALGRVRLTWFQYTLMYLVPIAVLVVVLLSGLRRDISHRALVRYRICQNHASSEGLFRAILKLGHCDVSFVSDEQDGSNETSDSRTASRLLATNVAIGQYHSFKQVEIPSGWQVYFDRSWKTLVGLTVGLWLAMWLFAPRDVSQWTWLVIFWTFVLWGALGVECLLETTERQRATDAIRQEAKRALAFLQRRGFPTESIADLQAVQAGLQTENYEAFEHLLHSPEHPQLYQAALAAYAELIFNRTTLESSEPEDPELVSVREAPRAVFCDHVPDHLVPRLTLLHEELPRLASAPHAPARRRAIMILHRLGPLIPHAIPILASMLDDADEQTKKMAAQVLAYMGKAVQEHLPRLLEMSLSSGRNAEAISLIDLQRIEPDGTRLASMLIDRLMLGDSAYQSRVVEFLAELDVAAAEAVIPLARLWSCEDLQLRKRATAATKKIVSAAHHDQPSTTRDRIVPALTSLLADCHPVHRHQAAELLRGLGAIAAEAVGSLTACVSDGYPTVRKAALEALADIDSSKALTARAAMPRRIAASDERMVSLRLALKNYKHPDELARLRKSIEERDQKIWQLGREKKGAPQKSRSSATSNALSFGLAALVTGLNPAQMLLTGAMYTFGENRAKAKADDERKEQLTGEIAELEERQQRDQQQVDRVMALYQCGLPIDSPEAIHSIGQLLDAETSADLLSASQSADDAQRLVATLLLGEEIAPLEERLNVLAKLLAEDPSMAVRQRAAISLSYLGDDAPSAAASLILAMRKDPEGLVRRWAVAALSSFPKQSDTVLPAVRDLLDDSDEDVRLQAAETLKTLTADGLPQHPMQSSDSAPEQGSEGSSQKGTT